MESIELQNEIAREIAREERNRPRKPVVFTNADRIRAMTDEELAMALPFPQCPPHEGKCMFSAMIANSCDQCWLDWLRQEVSQ